MNIAEQSTDGVVKAVKDAKKYGADGLTMLLPMRYAADDRETIKTT